MGTGSSVQPKQGVLANPRVVYADNLAKKNKKEYVIDTPVLIDLDHGSIRYRYANNEKGGKKKKEKAFEGEDKTNKGHYFYHTRLNDFSEKASTDREEPHKFMCVVKGPNSAKDKKVFYVYGKGFGAKDGAVTKPAASKAMGNDPNWPQRQNPYDVYYNIKFLDQVPQEDPIPGIPNRYKMEFQKSSAADTYKPFPMSFPLTSSDTVHDLKRKISQTIIKSSNNVHVCFKENELKGSEVIVDLMVETEEEKPEMYGVEVTLMPYGGQIDQ